MHINDDYSTPCGSSITNGIKAILRQHADRVDNLSKVSRLVGEDYGAISLAASNM